MQQGTAPPDSACADARAGHKALRRAADLIDGDYSVMREPMLVRLAREQRERVIATQVVDVAQTAVDAAVTARSGELPERIRLRHIFRRVSAFATADERAAVRHAMESYVTALDGGTPMAELARAHSDSESAINGGLIGWTTRDGLEPVLSAQLWKLEIHQRSGIVDTPLGLHVFQLEDRESARPPRPVDADALRGELVRDARRHAYRDFIVTRAGSLGLEPRRERLLPPLGDAATIVLNSPVSPLTLDVLLTRWRAQDFTGRRSLGLDELLSQEWEWRVLVVEALCSGFADSEAARAQRQQARETKKSGRMMRRYAERATDAQLRAFYAAGDRQRWWRPEERRLRGVVINFGERSAHAVYNDLDRLSREIAAGQRQFTDAARTVSHDASSVDSGDWDWVSAKSLASWAGPRFAQAVGNATTHELLGPLMVEVYDAGQLRYVPRAYALVRVESIRPEGIRPYEEIEPQVREEFARARINALPSQTTAQSSL